MENPAKLNHSQKFAFVLAQNDLGGHSKVVYNFAKQLTQNNAEVEIFVPVFTHFYYTKNLRNASSAVGGRLVMWVRYFVGQLRSIIFRGCLFWKGKKFGEFKPTIRRYIFSPKASELDRFNYVVTSGHWQITELENQGLEKKKIIHFIHHAHTSDPAEIEVSFRHPNFLILSPSRFTAGVLKELGVEKVRICHLGFDPQVFKPLKNYTQPGNKLLIGFFFYNHPRKNPRLILELIKILLDKYNSIEIHIFGNGFPKKFDVQVIVHEDLQENDYASKIAQLDLFIFISKLEGFGLPPLESMASGVATISSRVGAVEEFYPPAFGKELIDSDESADLWVKTISKFIDNKFLRESLSSEGLKMTQNWTWERSVSQFLLSAIPNRNLELKFESK